MRQAYATGRINQVGESASTRSRACRGAGRGGARATRRWHEAAAAAGGPGAARPHPHPTSGEGAGRRRTPGPDRQPAPPAARTADRLRSGPRGVAARRRDVAAWRDEGGGKGGRPRRGSPRTSAPHPTNQNGAARNLGGPGAGPRAPAGRSGGRPARARSPALTRSARTGGGGGSGRGPATPHLPARPTGAGRRGHGGRSATAGRGPDDPRSGERAGAGRGAAGGRTAVPPTSPNTQRRRRTGGGGGGGGPRSGAAAGPGSEAHRDAARGSADATDGADGRTGDRADEARLARPPPRRRGDDLAEDVAGGGGRAPTRGRPGGHPKGTDASRPPGHDTGSHRQRPPAQGRSRGTQDADWPPRPPNQGAPPRGARAHHRQTPTSRGQPRDNNTLPRAHRPPHVPRHTPPPPPPRPTPPRLRDREHSARGRRRPRRPGRATPSRGRGWLDPRRGRGRGGLGAGEGRRPRGGGGTHTHSGEGRGAGAQGRPPRDRKGRGTTGPARETSAGSHRHTHEGGPTTPGTPAGPGHPGVSHDPAPPPGPVCDGFPPRDTEGPVRPNSTSSARPRHIRLHLSPTPGARAPGKRSRARRPAPCPHTAPGRDSRRGQARRAPRGCGTGESGRPCVPEPHLGLATARVTARARTRAHTAPRRTPAWRDPPPTQRGEARAAVGKERRSAPPRGRRKPSREGEGLCRPTWLWQWPPWPTARLGGAAAGGSGTPRLPLGSLEKAFSPRVRHPPPIVCALRAHGGAPRATKSTTGRGRGGGVCGMGKHTAHWSVRGHSLGGTTSAAAPRLVHRAPEGGSTPEKRDRRPLLAGPGPTRSHPRPCATPHTHASGGRRHTRRRPGHEVSPPHGTPWEDDGDEVAGPRPPPRERNRGKPPRPLPSRPPQESHSRDTPPRRRPRGARWEKGTTPPLGLARLRDDLERSRGTTEDRASHAHAPAAGARRSGGTAPTDAGRTARGAHAKEAKRERLLRPRTTAPPTP